MAPLELERAAGGAQEDGRGLRWPEWRADWCGDDGVAHRQVWLRALPTEYEDPLRAYAVATRRAIARLSGRAYGARATPSHARGGAR